MSNPRPAFGTALIRCARRKCGWQGLETDLVTRPRYDQDGANLFASDMGCPKCGHTAYTFARARAALERVSPKEAT